MPTDKLKESEEEKRKAYGELVQELGTRFLQDPKRFKTAMNRVSDMLDIQELSQLKDLTGDENIESSGRFEDRFEGICGVKDQAVRREIVRLAFRHM